MTHYIFQGEQQPDLRLPWPVAVSEDGAIISGRPDAFRLVGFQVGTQQKIARFFDEAIQSPAWIKGKFPVYADIFGDGLFVVLERIESVTVVEKEVLGV